MIGTFYGPNRHAGAVRCAQQCTFHNVYVYLIKKSEPTSYIVEVKSVENLTYDFTSYW